VRELVEIAPGVLVATSKIMSTASTVLLDGSRALLIDPGWTPSELAGLADELAGRSVTVTGGFATHAHHDHLLWHPRFGDAPRFASVRTAELARSERDALLENLGAGWPAELVDLMGRVIGVEQIPEHALPGPIDLELVVHDGHAPGHTAVWLPRTRVLVAGDMLSDHELPLPFSPDDLPAYLAALDRLAPFVAMADYLIPGHGTPTDAPSARLDADRRYLDDVVRTGRSDDPRIGNPDMAVEYAHLQHLVREQNP
jgi:glyoxylase-like metal-dependent hydrolase (beta-lactamase superfamily II)